jgi:TRAP-type C4-dicarboxylate transport system permease small subunit
LHKIRDSFGKIVVGISYLGMLACLIVVIMVTADVVLRKLIHISILGSNEMTEMLMVVMLAFGFPALQVTGGHVQVDLIVNKIPGRGRFFYRGGLQLIEAGLLGLMVWGTYQKAAGLVAKKTTTAVLLIPQMPFVLLLCLGLLLFCMLLLMDAAIAFFDGIRYGK